VDETDDTTEASDARQNQSETDSDVTIAELVESAEAMAQSEQDQLDNDIPNQLDRRLNLNAALLSDFVRSVELDNAVDDDVLGGADVPRSLEELTVDIVVTALALGVEYGETDLTDALQQRYSAMENSRGLLSELANADSEEEQHRILDRELDIDGADFDDEDLKGFQ
jgi:hypothetical protein